MQFFYHTDEKIAKNLGVTRQAVCIARKKFNIPKFKDTKYKRNKIIHNMKQKGFTGQEISKRMNLSIKTVYRVLKKVE